MIITHDWLVERGACAAGIEWFDAQPERDGAAVVRALLTEDRLHWANWLVVRLLNWRGQIRYAINAEESVLSLCEAHNSDDGRMMRWGIKASHEDLRDGRRTLTRDAIWATEVAAWAAWASTVTAVAASAALRRYIEYGLQLLDGKEER